MRHFNYALHQTLWKHLENNLASKDNDDKLLVGRLANYEQDYEC